MGDSDTEDWGIFFVFIGILCLGVGVMMVVFGNVPSEHAIPGLIFAIFAGILLITLGAILIKKGRREY